MQKAVLALDLGTKTGWACSDGDFLESGVQDFGLKRGDGPGMRFLRFRKWLEAMLQDYDVVHVTYERPHNRGGHATEVLNGFSTRVMEISEQHGVDYSAVHSGTLKKHATGKGNAKKPEMMEVGAKLYGAPCIDDNHADALCLLQMALEGEV